MKDNNAVFAAVNDAHASPMKSFRMPSALDGMIKLLTIAVPLLYAVGRMYVEGYWDALGLPTGLAPYRADDYLYYGGTALVLPLIELVTKGPVRVAQVVLVGVVLAIAVALWLLMTRKLQPVLLRLARYAAPRLAQWANRAVVRVVATGIPVGAAVTLFLLSAVLLLLLTLLGLVVAINSGRATAESLRTQVTTHPEKFAQATWVDTNGVAGPGLVTSCTDDWCIVFEGRQFIARPRSSFNALSGAYAHSR